MIRVSITNVKEKMMNEYPNFYERIKNMAQARGITIAELERQLGLAGQTAKKWRQFTPNVDSLLKLSNFFGVSVEYLLGRETSISASDADLLRKYHALTDVQREAIDGAIDGFLARNPSSKQEIS